DALVALLRRFEEIERSLRLDVCVPQGLDVLPVLVVLVEEDARVAPMDVGGFRAVLRRLGEQGLLVAPEARARPRADAVGGREKKEGGVRGPPRQEPGRGEHEEEPPAEGREAQEAARE